MSFVRSDLFHNIAIGFVIGTFLSLLLAGPEMWSAGAPDALIAFIR